MILVVAAIGCDQGGGGGGGTGSGSAGSAVAAAAPAKNPGGGFSADLAKKLDTAGSGMDTPPRTNNTNAAGSAAKPDEMTGSADAKAGSAGSADAKVADAKAGSADAKAGSADAKAGSATAKVDPVPPPPTTKPPDKAGSADPKAGSATAKVDPVPPPPTTKPPEKAGSAVSTAPKINGNVVISSGTTPKGPVTVPAALKAINISLLPNWDRDVEAAGTISLAVKVPGKTEIATFVFRYGIEDAKAPADRDAYKKWLADNKLFTSKDDRQKGAAWYLEGVDGSNKPSFRMVVIYGGQKLICYGSLYKDSALGDLRDQTIIQAKQICETLTL